MPNRKVPIENRFWAKVDQSGDCWIWTGARDGHGYGHIKIDGRMTKAHRVSFEMARGEIPEGLDIDHLCRVRACVNPAHMEPVTRRINTLRGEGYTAKQANKTHCANGHPLDEANTYTPARGGRACRTCNRASVAAYAERRKAAR